MIDDCRCVTQTTISFSVGSRVLPSSGFTCCFQRILQKITREEKPEIKRAYDFIRDYVRNVHPGVSKVDVLCLAHAEQLNIPVVTDDEEMRIAATAYNIKTFKTLELLRLMLDCDYIDIKKIREIATYWIYLNDRPKDFNVDYKKLFGETPPK
ncbi:MAG: hypothetical protein ABRQ34_09545 [Smithellaceae bacterium]